MNIVFLKILQTLMIHTKKNIKKIKKKSGLEQGRSPQLAKKLWDRNGRRLTKAVEGDARIHQSDRCVAPGPTLLCRPREEQSRSLGWRSADGATC